jgi:hypothetical protein
MPEPEPIVTAPEGSVLDEDPFAAPPEFTLGQRVRALWQGGWDALRSGGEHMSAVAVGAAGQVRALEKRLTGPATPAAAAAAARRLLIARGRRFDLRFRIRIPRSIDVDLTREMLDRAWGPGEAAWRTMAVVVEEGSGDHVEIATEPLSWTSLLVVGDDEMSVLLTDPVRDVANIGRGLDRPHDEGANDIWVPASRLGWSRSIAQVRASGPDESWVFELRPEAARSLVARVVQGDGGPVIVPQVPRPVRPGHRIRIWEPATDLDLVLDFLSPAPRAALRSNPGSES